MPLSMIVVTPRRDDECHRLMARVLNLGAILASLNHRGHWSHALSVSADNAQFNSARRGRNLVCGGFGSLSRAGLCLAY